MGYWRQGGGCVDASLDPLLFLFFSSGSYALDLLRRLPLLRNSCQKALKNNRDGFYGAYGLAKRVLMGSGQRPGRAEPTEGLLS